MKKKIIATLLSAVMTFSLATGINYSQVSATTDNSVTLTEEIGEGVTEGLKGEDSNTLLDNPLPVDYFDDCNDSKSTGTMKGYTPRVLTSAGNVNNIVILIKFKGQDTSTVYPESTIKNIVNTYNGDSYSLKDYYNHVSGGKINVNAIQEIE